MLRPFDQISGRIQPGAAGQVSPLQPHHGRGQSKRSGGSAQGIQLRHTISRVGREQWKSMQQVSIEASCVQERSGRDQSSRSELERRCARQPRVVSLTKQMQCGALSSSAATPPRSKSASSQGSPVPSIPVARTRGSPRLAPPLIDAGRSTLHSGGVGGVRRGQLRRVPNRPSVDCARSSALSTSLGKLLPPPRIGSMPIRSQLCQSQCDSSAPARTAVRSQRDGQQKRETRRQERQRGQQDELRRPSKPLVLLLSPMQCRHKNKCMERFQTERVYFPMAVVRMHWGKRMHCGRFV